jgi:hypothetical protein
LVSLATSKRDAERPTPARSNHSIACSVEMISSSPWPQPSRSS